MARLDIVTKEELLSVIMAAYRPEDGEGAFDFTLEDLDLKIHPHHKPEWDFDPNRQQCHWQIMRLLPTVERMLRKGTERIRSTLINSTYCAEAKGREAIGEWEGGRFLPSFKRIAGIRLNPYQRCPLVASSLPEDGVYLAMRRLRCTNGQGKTATNLDNLAEDVQEGLVTGETANRLAAQVNERYDTRLLKDGASMEMGYESPKVPGLTAPDDGV